MKTGQWLFQKCRDSSPVKRRPFIQPATITARSKDPRSGSRGEEWRQDYFVSQLWLYNPGTRLTTSICPSKIATAPYPRPVFTSTGFERVAFLERPRPSPLMVHNNNDEIDFCNLYSSAERRFADIIDGSTRFQSSSANVVKRQTGDMEATRPIIINEARHPSG